MPRTSRAESARTARLLGENDLRRDPIVPCSCETWMPALTQEDLSPISTGADIAESAPASSSAPREETSAKPNLASPYGNGDQAVSYAKDKFELVREFNFFPGRRNPSNIIEREFSDTNGIPRGRDPHHNTSPGLLFFGRPKHCSTYCIGRMSNDSSSAHGVFTPRS